MVRERLRVWEGLLVIALSDSELEESNFGGEFEIRSYTFRDRRIGPLAPLCGEGEFGSVLVLGGKVRAQFSQGIALFLSFSSHVLP